MTHFPNVCLGYRLEGISSSVTENQLFHMSWLDFATMVDDVAGGGDQNLREMQAGDIDLTVAQGDIDTVFACGLTDSPHFVRVRRETVLAICFKKRK